jgi:exosome complex component CSL4
MVEAGEFVVPGEELGFSEEFIPGRGTYEENGRIFASLTGVLRIDMKERRIEVEPKTNTIPEPRVGDIAICKVVDVKQQFALVKLVRLLRSNRELPGNVYGTIHISQLRSSYVQDIDREIKVGDVVLAKVTNTRRVPIALSTVAGNLGAIKAYCTSCNIALKLQGRRLVCPNCGRYESRKYSSEYGKGVI